MAHDRRDRTPTRLIRHAQHDLERLDAATAELKASLEIARRTTAKVEKFAEDLDTDRLSTDGVVLETVDDNDTVVRDLRVAIRALGAA